MKALQIVHPHMDLLVAQLSMMMGHPTTNCRLNHKGNILTNAEGLKGVRRLQTNDLCFDTFSVVARHFFLHEE